MTRPLDPETNESVMLSFRVPASLAKRLRAAASRSNLKTSALTRQLVERALARLAEEEERPKKKR